jgi:hypothetical protein
MEMLFKLHATENEQSDVEILGKVSRHQLILVATMGLHSATTALYYIYISTCKVSWLKEYIRFSCWWKM